MARNLGGTERAIRVAVGMGLIGGALFVEQPGWGVGVIYVVGGWRCSPPDRFLPPWKIFGVNTCPPK